VAGHFDPSTSLRAGAFERAYPDLFQSRYGFWRPVIRRAVDKFLKCGDLKEGFARVRLAPSVVEGCPGLRARAVCGLLLPSAGLLPLLRPEAGAYAGAAAVGGLPGPGAAPAQWVFTIPKRLRVFFRYNRRLLGKLCRAAYETVNGTMA